MDAARLRLTPAEAATVRERAAARGLTVGAYLRLAALDRVPPAVPEINRAAWAELARAAAALNQLARRLNVVAAPAAAEVAEARRLLAELRAALIGARRGLDQGEAEEGGP